jgi:hypothetical protein
MQLLILQFSAASCYILTLGSKSPQFLVLKLPSIQKYQLGNPYFPRSTNEAYFIVSPLDGSVFDNHFLTTFPSF